MSTRPDADTVLAGLKDFQRSTVDYVFDRLYGENHTRRFLVADEVGLGKTLIAKGVIARTIEHLKNDVPRIDVVYVCSNADIAKQNMQRLGSNATATSTRLTLLPLQLQKLEKKGVNFIALTPGTSFDQNAYGGRIEERVLLHSLLDEAWDFGNSRKPLNVLSDYASTEAFEKQVEAFDRNTVNRPLAKAFIKALEKQVADEIAEGRPDLRSRFDELQQIFHRKDVTAGREATVPRTRWIGELRRLLSRVCLNALEPDLIIFDEFQRFDHLLNDQSEAGELAKTLFESEAGHGARLLLLSATPYKGLSLHHEQEGRTFSEFSTLLRFLERSGEDDCDGLLENYRSALPYVRGDEGLAKLREAKEQLQQRLLRVMARTEKFSTTATRAGMLQDRSDGGSRLAIHEVKAFQGAQNIASYLGEGDVVEYWKSSPYLFNFMDSYTLKTAFTKAAGERALIELVKAHPETFLPVDRMRSYKPVEPSNARMRGLMEDMVDRGMWQLLWLPPSLGYYQPDGPHADPALRGATKRLVFSAWHVVPKAIATLLSYEAERRMMRASTPKGKLTTEMWKKKRGLLRFGSSGDRLTGMPLMCLVYPCLTFARECDPRDLARSGPLSAAAAADLLADKISRLIDGLRIRSHTDGPADERWYWMVPMLLDLRHFPDESQAWWNLPNLPAEWADQEAGEEDAAWPRHIHEAHGILNGILASTVQPGPPPEDLLTVLALSASAGPATAALRALSRTSGISPAGCIETRIAAGRAGRAFLTLFNHTEVTEMVRSEYQSDAYWRRVLGYCHAGQLQAVLDEYCHVLRESLGLSASPPSDMARKMAPEIIASVTLRAASLRVDRIEAPPYTREVRISAEPVRVRFAMRFGDERKDEDATLQTAGRHGTRKERVRAAFNSPFWPFVLASTSVGQEGLDFHPYCHAITHWNLPANPVDLEQREGRIHRYKGHSIRKNLATAHGPEALASTESDPWDRLFSLAVAQRQPEANDLVPYWHYPGEAMIERHVPALPFSREVDRLALLRKTLTLYRLVLGQSRQEDLIAFLLNEIPDEEHAAIVAELRIDLTPPDNFRRPKHSIAK